MPKLIYLDFASTTPADPRVVQAMQPFWSETFGNAASNHALGWQAKQAVDEARQQLADLINAEQPEALFFTASATESNNLALKGFAQANVAHGRHLISQTTEHSSVLGPLRALEAQGFTITWLNPDEHGRISASQVEQAITPQTILATIMAANNEIGTVQPIAEIAAVCRRRGVAFHTDAAQAVGKIPLDVCAADIDLLTLSGHKMYGPKGSAALYVAQRKPALKISPQLHGGSHERGLRPSTLAVPLIVGLGEAARLAQSQIQDDMVHGAALRERLWKNLQQLGVSVRRFGDPQYHLPGILSVGFAGIDGEMLFKSLSYLCLSSGAACASGSGKASHVLTAIGVPEALARASLRFSLGRPTTADDVDAAAEQVKVALQQIR